MKRRLSILLALILLMNLAGCASLPKKFIRKKKQPKHVASAIYLQSGPYQKKYSNEYYYKTHYTFWQSWHSEWMDQLGGNTKKVRRCAQETVNNLVEMNRYLKPEKQAELEPVLEDLKKLQTRIESGAYSDSDEGPTRVELERLKRAVGNQFYFNKVKDDLLPEEVDLSAPATPAPAPAS